MDSIVEFARRMKAHREKMGLTQAQLGEKIGVSAQTISAYEKNISGDRGKAPTLDKVIPMAKALGVSLDYLCGIAPAEKSCQMESLKDVAECLMKISHFVACYGASKLRDLDDYEISDQMCEPEDFRISSMPVAVFVLDNEFLAKFFDTKNKLLALYSDKTLSKDLYDTIISGQLAELQQYSVYQTDRYWGDLAEITFI